MKLSPFMKEHKKNLKKLNKKELIDQVLLLTEYNAQSSASHDMEVAWLERQRDDLEECLERRTRKYKGLLELSIENL